MLEKLFAGAASVFIPSRVPATKATPISAPTGMPTSLSLDGGGMFAPGGKELIKSYNDSPALRRVVSIVAHSLASTPFFLRRKTRGKRKDWSLATRTCVQREYRHKATKEQGIEVYDHPFLDFLSRGSPLLSGPSSLVLSYVYRLVKGEFFWELIGEGKLPEFWMVTPPQWVTQVPHGNKDYFIVRQGGQQKRVAAEHMFWCRDADLTNPYSRGKGAGDSLADEIDTDEYASALLRHTLANRGFSDVLIGIKGARPQDAELVEAKYNQRHRGFYNTGRALIIDSEKLEVKPITHALSELRLLELRDFERTVIAETFGVPSELLGKTQNSNRATITGAETIFAKYVLSPRLEAMRVDLQLRLLPLFDPRGEYLIEYESPIPADRDYDLEVMKAQPSAFTLNEYRQQIGLEPTTWGSTRLIPFNYAEVPVTSKQIYVDAQQNSAPTYHGVVHKGTGVSISQTEMKKLLETIDSAELVEKLGPDWQQRMEQVVLAEWAQLGFADGSLALVNPLIADHLKEFGGRWTKRGGIDATTRALLGESLAAGVDAGEGISELAKRVRHTMGDVANGYRAQLIARTEVVRSSNLARDMSWKTTGLSLHKRYISALTKDTRKAHAALHGNEIPVHKQWTYSATLDPGVSDTIDMPGDSEHPAHACNCLCTAVAFDPEHAKDVDIPYQGEAHYKICKAFDEETERWEQVLRKAMRSFYEHITDEIVTQLQQLG